MAGGRPTSWTQEIEDKAWEYANGAWESVDVFPKLAGLCLYINVPKSTIYDWAKHDDKKFSDILSKINETQENNVLNNAMAGDYNSNIAKLVLGKHGYSDKVEQKVESTVNLSCMSDDQLNAKLKALISESGSAE